MDERRALLSAILANPTDDTPRLVFADWLDEHAEGAWAVLIRWQCHIPGPELTQPEFRRAAQLWFREHGGPTTRGDGSVSVSYTHRIATKCRFRNGGVRPHQTNFVLRRGFVSEVRYETLAGFLAEAAALFAAHPVTSVRIGNREPGPNATWHGNENWATDRSLLPPAFFAGFWQYGILPEGGDAVWESPQKAVEALSALCVAHGRELAGLESPA